MSAKSKEKKIVTSNEFESLTPLALIHVEKDLKSKLDWVRIRAQEMILSRTRPTRETRTITFDVDSLQTILDLAAVGRTIFFKSSQGDITTKEAQGFMNLLHSLKEIIIDAEYGELFEELKSFAEKSTEWKEYLKSKRR